jgi:hypothetical protein
MIPINLGDTEIETEDDPCTAATQWVVMKSTENGKCFKVCIADPHNLFEVACPDSAIETAGIKQTSESGQSPLAGQTIIKGVPNWVVIGGAAVLGVILANR